jgi:hypothetical protein
MSERHNRKPTSEPEAEVNGEVNETIAQLFANAHAVFARVIGGYTIPVPRKYKPGHVCSAADALALDMRRAQMLSATAQSNMERGAWSKLSDEEKVDKAKTYAASYELSSDVGASNSLLEAAITRIVEKLAESQGVTLSTQKRDENVVKIMNTPNLTVKYGPQVRTMIETILAERHAKKERKSGDAGSGLEL